jgi:hypothetical protein
MCGLGAIEIGALGPINMLPFDPKQALPSRNWASYPTSTNHCNAGCTNRLRFYTAP